MRLRIIAFIIFVMPLRIFPATDKQGFIPGVKTIAAFCYCGVMGGLLWDTVRAKKSIPYDHVYVIRKCYPADSSEGITGQQKYIARRNSNIVSALWLTTMAAWSLHIFADRTKKTL